MVGGRGGLFRIIARKSCWRRGRELGLGDRGNMGRAGEAGPWHEIVQENGRPPSPAVASPRSSSSLPLYGPVRFAVTCWAFWGAPRHQSGERPAAGWGHGFGPNGVSSTCSMPARQAWRSIFRPRWVATSFAP